MSAGAVPGYLSRLVAMAAVGVIRPGTVTIVDVLHDAACPALSGGGCGCRPELQLRPVHADGSIGGGPDAS